jgi:hypothetical protein
VETLDIYHRHGIEFLPGHVQFRRGCQHLVVLIAYVTTYDAHVVVGYIRSFRHSLRQLDLTCGPILAGFRGVEILRLSLGLLKGLQSLKFDAEYVMTKEDSFAGFQGECLQLEDQGGSGSTTTET